MLWNSYSIAAGAVAKIISRPALSAQARDARRAAGFRCCGAHLYDATDPELVRRWRCQEGQTVPVPILMPGLGLTLVAAPPDPRTKYAAGSLTCPRATPPRRSTGTGGRTGTTTSPRPGRPGVAGVSGGSRVTGMRRRRTAERQGRARRPGERPPWRPG
jgi:hypothetical protein